MVKGIQHQWTEDNFKWSNRHATACTKRGAGEETTTEKYLKENGQDLCKVDENIYSCRGQRSKRNQMHKKFEENYSKATTIKYLKSLSSGNKRILKQRKKYIMYWGIKERMTSISQKKQSKLKDKAATT